MSCFSVFGCWVGDFQPYPVLKIGEFPFCVRESRLRVPGHGSGIRGTKVCTEERALREWDGLERLRALCVLESRKQKR